MSGIDEIIRLKREAVEAAERGYQDECEALEFKIKQAQLNYLRGKNEEVVASISDFVPPAPLTSPSEISDDQWCSLMCGEYHHADCPVGAKLRDCWTTPKWLTDLLPRVTLDPCSNPRSTVLALRHIMLEPVTTENDPFPGGWAKSQSWEQGDGLAVSWKNRTVFVNPPYSAIMPWARKAGEAKAFIFLVNNVTTTKWYRELLANGGSYKFEFDKRLKFEPPPRIKPSTNNRDQVLICNREGWEMIGDRLASAGRWWVEHVGYVDV